VCIELVHDRCQSIEVLAKQCKLQESLYKPSVSNEKFTSIAAGIAHRHPTLRPRHIILRFRIRTEMRRSPAYGLLLLV
jgi:hypothetical protein